MNHTHKTPTRSNITFTLTFTQKNTLSPTQKKRISKQNPYLNYSYFEICHMYHTPKYI